MTIDEVLGEAKIEFPRVLSLADAENLLGYVAKNMPAEIRHNSSYNITLALVESEKVAKLAGSVQISGSIADVKNGRAYDGFNFNKCSGANTPGLSGMTFDMVPGWKISEYRPEVRKLWGDVRRLVRECFDRGYLTEV